MAGIFKNIPSCSVHGKRCFIKTGSKDGPAKGKTFFICGNQQEQCSFAMPASGIPATVCPQHNIFNELQAFCKKEDGLRCYYRCPEGRKLKIGWCGYEKMRLEDENRLVNVTNKSKVDLGNRNERQNGIKTFPRSSNGEKTAEKDSKGVDKVQIATSGKENEGLAFAETRKGFNPSVPTMVKGQTRSSSGLQERQRADNIALGEMDTNLKGNGQIQERGNGEKMTESLEADANLQAVRPVASENADTLKHDAVDVIVIDDDDDSSDRSEEKQDQQNEYQQLYWQEKSLEREVMQLKANMKTVHVHLLPDKGKRLMQKTNVLEVKLNEIRKRKMQIAKSCPSDQVWSVLEVPVQSKQGEGRSREVFPNLGIDLPHSTVQFQGPDHFVKQKLYEGRMTSSKLKQVGRITRDAIETLHRSLETCPSAATECEDPNGLLVSLMAHQKQALAWLLWREKQMPPGGILADDMGLGKTLTSIALILKDKQVGSQKKATVPSNLRDSNGTLVICPASLVHHWKKEIEKRVKPLDLTVCLYHGATREKNVERLSRYDVVLTTYSIVALEAKDFVESEERSQKRDGWLSAKDAPSVAERRKNHNSIICLIHWKRIILDEAHNIKNPKSNTSMAVCFLEAESRWALTGTPIQNNTKDLYAIIKFLRCCPFDEFKVWTKWVDDKSAKGTERMNTLVRSLLLRRTKEQHLTCLPSRDSVTHAVSLNDTEKSVYDSVKIFSKTMLRRFLGSQGNGRGTMENRFDCEGAGQKETRFVLGKEVEELMKAFGLVHDNVTAGAILLMVLRLRQCCSHLSLLLEVPDAEDVRESTIDLPIEQQMGNLSIVDTDSPETEKWSPDELKKSFISSKLRSLLAELHKLKSIASNGKAIKSVVVSQWTKMLDIVAFHLQKDGVRYNFITGSISLKKRSEIVEDFNNNPSGAEVILVSLRAGGVGLNLIGGSHLFLVDQHWNPALESQACDRIYRVGQQSDVVIHRFLCTDTVEEKITALQEKKKSLAANVLKGGKQSGSNLSLQDLRLLFEV